MCTHMYIYICMCIYIYIHTHTYPNNTSILDRQHLLTFTCTYVLTDYYKSVAVIYDYSSITSQQLKVDFNSLQTRLNQQLVSEIVLVENNCDDSLTSDTAAAIVKEHSNVRLMVVEAAETVSAGRARIAAVKQITSPFLLFLSAGNMPDSPKFLGK